jgi:hypothetical protein
LILWRVFNFFTYYTLKTASSIIIQDVPLKKQSYYIHEFLQTHSAETKGDTEFLQPYPVVAADALLEIATAVISAALSLDDPLSQTDTSCVPKVCYKRLYRLIRYILSGYALLNASLTPAKDFDAKYDP